ncbi:YigZ family protein [Arcanobacterium phocisimile]|uniref:YigZ family protein n=1 Tax=Arcanobacterium phocisimile TaxID=1302235 RepID=A0ABX7IHR9_9ACTO|nr:YigZ family protein [Arcanobacterium phocisimile]QRV02617.1 YigZ family protein [Arcanobacterium phocisimile]
MTTLLRLPAGTQLRSELEIKRSRFITLIRRVESAQAARDLLSDARNEFPDARHHCSAYVISVPGAQPLNHSSDDGEPSGTAGRPMLDVLLGGNLTDIAAVVVRYFGGTLLGTGGLVRAYSDSVRTALLGTPLVAPVSRQVRRLTLPHSFAGKFDADARMRGYDVVDTVYESSGVTFRVAVDDLDSFDVFVSEMTKGARTAQPDGNIVLDIPTTPFTP